MNRNNLLFFNKEGYQYNFEYNDEKEAYDGKILFDENSNDTFKTIGMYIFEEVKPITFSSDLKLNKMELYNNSGISFHSAEYINEKIIKIDKVNSSPDFYSKWIFGENFDKKFPKGSLVSFSNMNFINPTSDFDFNYYNVLDNKPNAIMILTNTKNSLWDNVLSGGTINSVNIVSYNDYDSTLRNKIENFTLHQDKKITISGTEYNDAVNSYKNSGVSNTYYQTWDLSGMTDDTLKMELTLFTERPKLYQGEVNFILTGNTAYLKFKNGFSSLFNIEEGEQIIFEDYEDNPILPTNPIFTIVDGTNEFDLYNNNIEFFKKVNINKTLIKSFNSTSISAKRISNNSEFFSKNIDFFVNHLPSNLFVYDNYIKISGTTDDWVENVSVDDKLQFIGLNNNSYKNSNREVSIKKIEKFRDIRIKYWEDKINNSAWWLHHVKRRALLKKRLLNQQIRIEAIEKYDKYDNNPESIKYIPHNKRYEYIYFNEYLIEEDVLNNYKIKKLLNVSDIKTVVCNFSPSTITDQSFTKNVIGYDTTNILTFETQLIKNSGNSNIVDFDETVNNFNKKYSNELDKYGLKFYVKDDKFNLHSLYYTNLNQKNYLETTLYINNNSAITSTSGISNSQIDTVFLELNDKLKNEIIYPFETEKFDKNYYCEIMLDLKNNENEYGVNIEINDIEFYTKFDTSNIKTINNFLNEYQEIFYNNGLVITSGLTTEPVFVDNYKQVRINYWTKKIIDSPKWYSEVKEKALVNDTTIDIELYNEALNMYNSYDPTEEIEYPSGQTMLIINGRYPNVDVRTLKVKVNSYSEYEIMNEVKNKALFLTGNEIEITNVNSPSFFDYGLSTGMIISLSGSLYSQNNKSYNILGLTEHEIELSYQGTFFDDETNITITTQSYLRKPRDSYNKDIYYSFKFKEPYNNEDITKDIFFYDITGEHLKPAKDINGDYIESTRYVGPKPLWTIDNECNDDRITLIDKPNDNINYIDNPLKQQTVFRGEDGGYALEFLLDQYDSRNEYNFSNEPLQVFLGFNSPDEGVEEVQVVMDLIDETCFSGYTNSDDYTTGIEFTFDEDGLLSIIKNGLFDFSTLGFEKGQSIIIDFIDESKTGTTTFLNHGEMKIEYVSGKKLKINKDELKYVITPFDTRNTSKSFFFNIKVQPKTLLTLDIIGETEIEDERFDINLKNLGITLNEDIEHIFIDSDIKEDGIDYKLLNKKRKEMLAMYPEIYNYIGSYKALINSINFFGWNDLELNEYYRNLNPNSDLYQKLQKVRIQDIFDNTVDGWTDNDYIKGKYDNNLYKKTNLFNLTYRITDEDGNNILMYSLDEIQIKLTKLKRWLKNHVVPLSANLVDITGVAQTKSTAYHQFNVSNFIKKTHSTNEATGINFNFSETLNFEQNYLFQLDFYTLNDYNPSGWTCKIQTFNKNSEGKLIPQQYFKLMKNDLNSFSFNIDKDIDKYIYIETKSFNDYGLGQVYNKFLNSSTSKNYLLVNNNFKIPGEYAYLPVNGEYYWFDENGYIWIED